MKSIFLFLSVLFALVFSLVSSPSPSPLAVNLKKRSISSSTAVKSISNSALTSFANSARSLQLSALNQKDGRTVAQWQLYINQTQEEYLTNFDLKTLILNSPLTPLVVAAAIGILLGILTPVCGLFWLCLRRCNTCGGARPKEDGYEASNIYQLAGIFVVFTVITLSFAGVFIGFSNQFTVMLGDVSGGFGLAVNSTLDTLNSTAAGIDSSPAIVQSTITNILNEIGSGPLSTQINVTFGPIVDTLVADFSSIDQLKYDLIAVLNNTNSSINEMRSISDSLPPLLHAIGQNITALSNLTILGQTYTIAGFPDVSQLTDFNAPDLSSIPDIQSFIDQVQAVPDLTSYGVSISDQLNSIASMIQDFVNGTLATQIPSLNGNSAVSGISNSINSTQMSIQNIVNPIQQQINSVMVQVYQYDSYRSIGMLVEMLLIIVPGAIAFLSLFTKKRIFMTPFCTCILFLAIFVWLEFVIFYFVSAPLNIVCNSKEAVLSANYVLPINVADLLGGSNASQTSISITPDSVIQSCLAGDNIFDATINTNGQTVKDILSAAIEPLINQYIDVQAINNSIQLPDFQSAVNGIDLSSLNSFNSSSLELPNFSLNINITQLSQNISNAASMFAPTSLDPNLGNSTLRDQAIAEFNSDLLSIDPDETAFTAQFILDTFVLGSSVFNASNFTHISNQNDPENVELVTLYNDAEARTAFIYYANLALSQTINSLNLYVDEIQSIQDNQLQTLTTLLGQVQTVSTAINSIISQMVGIITNVQSAIVSQFSSDLTSFINWTIDYMISLVQTSIIQLIDDIFVDNPVNTFGKCDELASSANYVIDSICVEAVDTLSGIWFAAMFIGILFVLSFVSLVLIKKRIEYLETRNNTVKDKKVKDYEMGGFSADSSNNVLATVPMDDASAPEDIHDTRPMSSEEYEGVEGSDEPGFGVDQYFNDDNDQNNEYNNENYQEKEGY